jgi:hypothetical protein
VSLSTLTITGGFHRWERELHVKCSVLGKIRRGRWSQM